jgi:hypothetical protein
VSAEGKPLVRRYKAKLAQGTYRTGVCARCEQTAPIVGRGLCDACKRWCYRNGSMEDYPRETNRAADVYAEYELIRSGGGTLEELAARIGVSVRSLQYAIRQHRLKAAR